MDIAFYALVTLAALVLVLAMWSCAARGVNEWGPDMTPELLPYIMQEHIRLQKQKEAENREKAPRGKLKKKVRPTAPSAPTDSIDEPLLSEVQTTSRIQPKRKAPPPPPPPKPKRIEPVFKNTVVRVLPPDIKYHPLRPTVQRFSTEEPV